MTEEQKQKAIERSRKWYAENKDRAKDKMKLYRELNKDILKIKAKESYQNNRDKIKSKSNNRYYNIKDSETFKIKAKKYRVENKKLISDLGKKYRENNIKKRNEKSRIKYHTNINHKLLVLGRNRAIKACKISNTRKHESYTKVLGCTAKEFKNHIESLFTDGMTWDNMGKWHLDHIKPCASFDLSDINQFKECFHYTNQRPLWASDNLSKSSFYEGVKHYHKKA